MTPDESALLASYWGKADPDVARAGRDHHTVLGHSLDVAACAFTLVDRHPVLRERLVDCTGMDHVAVAPTFAAVCALHDVGKLDTRFQRKASQVADVLRPHTAAIPRGKYDHGTEGFRQIEDDEEALDQLLRDVGRSGVPILRAVCGHHGALPSRDEPASSRTTIPRAIRREDARARSLFLSRVVSFFKELGAALPWQSTVDAPLVQRLAGICAIADWLGSNTDAFTYEPGPIVDLHAYWTRACDRAYGMCERAGLLRSAVATVDFGTLFPGYSPRDVQRLTERVPTSDPALIIVEAEMGKGKTEAALSVAARFLSRGLADGVTVALPTMATSNAMFRRVEDVADRLFPSGAVHMALAHSRASRQTGFQALVQRGLLARDEDSPEASVVCARWLLNRKRVLLAQVGVGTIDQALQAALVVRHQFVRMFGLSRNVVIIDEVHAYDAYMEVLLEHLLAWLGALRVPVILLSATLPSVRRTALARAFRGGQGAPLPTGDDDVATAAERPYPLVSVTTSNGTSTLAGETISTREIVLERVANAPEDDQHVEAVSATLVDAAAAGARVVWIRNTVREAQRAYRAVAKRAAAIDHTLFHARFRGRDRSAIEAAVLDRYGKAAPPGGRILVATQVVEQSLDLDFDVMHSDLAPIDLLFQRVGRVHRHVRARPRGFEVPHLVVHAPSDDAAALLRFGPSRFVYDAGTLWLTLDTLRVRTTLSLPTDIRPMVERVYHPTSRAENLSRGGPRLVAMEAEREGVLEAKRAQAKRCCIPPTTADADGGELLDDDDDAVQAFTRDGTSATLLPFWWDGQQGRALYADPTSSPWNLAAERGDAWRLASDLLDETLSMPAGASVEADVPLEERAAFAAWRMQFRAFAEQSGIGARVVPIPLRRSMDAYKGWLRMGNKRRRVYYAPTVGLLMPSEKDEEYAR